MEAFKSQDLHLAICRPKRADRILVSSRSAINLRTPEELTLQFKSEGRKNLMCQHHRQDFLLFERALLFSRGLQRIG